MTQHAPYLHLDDPDELAEVARERPARGGARRMEAVLTIDGVHCAACVVAIENALRDAVDEVSVNAATRRARVVFDPDVAPLSGLLARIDGLGYRPRPVARSAVASAEAAGRRTSLWRMLVAVLCMMQVMMYAVPRYVAHAGDMPADVERLLTWAQWMLTLPVLLFAAGPFFRGAWRDLRARRVGMDVPVALGIAVTFGASSSAALSGGEVYFDSLTMFVAFLLVGRWLEAAARERALLGVGDLLARLPETVERLDAGGAATVVTLRAVRAGDRVRVAVGQAVPADGRVETGRSHADESLLTGESRPIPKGPGDALAAGSLNLDGPLTMRVLRAPARSRLREIADLIESASARKPKLAQLADRWAGPFLVAVLVLAALAWLAWQWIDPSRATMVAASVLVVTCPCALSLATPTALLAAAGNLARGGVLARSPQAIESLAQADAFVFDKTGTLTTDRPVLAAVHLEPSGTPAGAPAPDRAGALALAAALEAGSLHPLAAALRDAAPTGQPLPALRDVREHGGGGIEAEAMLDGAWHAVRLGSARFALPARAADRGIAHPSAEGAGDRHLVPSNPGDSGPAAPDAGDVHLAIDGVSRARFELAETLRPDAADAIAALRAAGLPLRILSGDAPVRVARIAALLGVDDWRAHATPEDKLDSIAAMQRDGRRVAMVGDGINDAPVLASAHVSIAFATGAALAQHHADLLLLGDRLEGIVRARRLAVRTMTVVAQNLAFAAVYNVVCIPLALAGLLPPWIAGTGMAASSLLVVLNAMRLARPARAASTADRAAAGPRAARAASA